jgi:very-short-patch-repair endonuclease
MSDLQYYPEKPRMQRVDKIDVLNRMNIALRPIFEKHAGETFRALWDPCESPIELILGAAILHHNHLDRSAFRRGQLAVAKSLKEAGEYALIPQFEWKNFRVDFCLLVESEGFPVFVECDGADFHQLNDGQRQRDAKKNAAFEAAGISYLRFTGKEISADAAGCAARIDEMVRSACSLEA